MLEWCAGYGGIGLGLKKVFGKRLRCLAYCELEGYAQANLIGKMEAGFLDAAPIWTDVKTFPNEEFHGLVDILVAGYPCQPFSAVGKRNGEDDPRHLWPYIRTAIDTIQPRLCFFENVEGHITLGLSTVISDLEELGYKVSWGIFSAAEVGAPHQRKRVFIMANRISEGLEGHARYGSEICRQGWIKAIQTRSTSTGGIWPSYLGEQQHGWEPPRTFEPKMGRDSHGSSGGMGYVDLCISCDSRTDELRLLGNGVVPAVAERAAIVLMKDLYEQTANTRDVRG
jgi:site-specific DNA-cytosine methylase